MPLAGIVVPIGVAFRLASVAVSVEVSVVNAPLDGVILPTGVVFMVVAVRLLNVALPLTASTVNAPEDGVVAPIGVESIAAAVKLPVKLTNPLAVSEVKAPAAGVEVPIGIALSAAILKLANVAVSADKLVKTPDAGVVLPIGVALIAAALRLLSKFTNPVTVRVVKTPAAGIKAPIGAASRLLAVNAAKLLVPETVKVVKAPVEPLIGVLLIAAAAKLPPKFTAPVVDNVVNLPVEGVAVPIGMPSIEPAVRLWAPLQILGRLSSEVLENGNSKSGTLPALSNSATPLAAPNNRWSSGPTMSCACAVAATTQKTQASKYLFMQHNRSKECRYLAKVAPADL